MFLLSRSSNRILIKNLKRATNFCPRLLTCGTILFRFHVVVVVVAVGIEHASQFQSDAFMADDRQIADEQQQQQKPIMFVHSVSLRFCFCSAVIIALLFFSLSI